VLDLNVVGGILLAALVYVLLRLKEADQWHHGWLLLAALNLPPYARYAALIIGADDVLNHWIEWLTGRKEMSPLAMFYWWVYPTLTKVYKFLGV
jgi:hypothetical protein